MITTQLDISMRLNFAMAECKINSKSLAKQLNISHELLSLCCNGLQDIPMNYIVPICDILDISVVWLLMGDGLMHQSDLTVNYREYAFVKLLRTQTETAKQALFIILQKLAQLPCI